MSLASETGTTVDVDVVEPDEQNEPDELSANTSTISSACQTDLTSLDVSKIENDLQSVTHELTEVRIAQGFPRQEDLKESEKCLRFYTGFNNFDVLMSVYNLVSVAIHDGGASKL